MGSQLMQVVIFGTGIVTLLLLIIGQSTGSNKRSQPLKRAATSRTVARHIEQRWMAAERYST